MSSDRQCGNRVAETQIPSEMTDRILAPRFRYETKVSLKEAWARADAAMKMSKDAAMPTFACTTGHMATGRVHLLHLEEIHQLW